MSTLMYQHKSMPTLRRCIRLPQQCRIDAASLGVVLFIMCRYCSISYNLNPYYRCKVKSTIFLKTDTAMACTVPFRANAHQTRSVSENRRICHAHLKLEYTHSVHHALIEWGPQQIVEPSILCHSPAAVCSPQWPVARCCSVAGVCYVRIQYRGLVLKTI